MFTTVPHPIGPLKTGTGWYLATTTRGRSIKTVSRMQGKLQPERTTNQRILAIRSHHDLLAQEQEARQFDTSGPLEPRYSDEHLMTHPQDLPPTHRPHAQCHTSASPPQSHSQPSAP